METNNKKTVIIEITEKKRHLQGGKIVDALKYILIRGINKSGLIELF